MHGPMVAAALPALLAHTSSQVDWIQLPLGSLGWLGETRTRRQLDRDPFALTPSSDRALKICGGAVDLERTEIRLGSLQEYCVIASILLGAVLDIYSDTPMDENATKVEQVAQSLHGICICVGFLAALYTTVVFSLFGLYAKTALGVGDDDGYLQFMTATNTIRLRGFQSFLVCLCSFNTSFLLNMFLNHRGRTRWTISLLSVIGMGVSLSHFRDILRAANEIIFRAR